VNSQVQAAIVSSAPATNGTRRPRAPRWRSLAAPTIGYVTHSTSRWALTANVTAKALVVRPATNSVRNVSLIAV
jgi:hypothetical protein